LTAQTLPKTKKERIKELLATGLKAEQIASQLNTTRDYVYKEKGRIKKKELEVAEQSLSVSDGSHNVTVLRSHNPIEPVSLDQNEISNAVNNNMSEYDIPPLDSNDVKTMYTSFVENKDWRHVSAKYGIRPDISQREYFRSLTMSSRDPFELQNKILSRLSNPPASVQEIVNKSAKGDLLTNDELLLVIDLISLRNSSKFLQDIIAFPTIEIPSGLSRIQCSHCHQLQAGVIYDSTTYAGDITKMLVNDGHFCSNCFSLRNQAIEEVKRTYSPGLQ